MSLYHSDGLIIPSYCKGVIDAISDKSIRSCDTALQYSSESMIFEEYRVHKCQNHPLSSERV